jgi:predicted transcriptional regulator
MLFHPTVSIPALTEVRPKQLSLGPLEREILEILWASGQLTVREVHETLLVDPERELAYPTVTTILRRLEKKGWVRADRGSRTFRWEALLTRDLAEQIWAYEQFCNFVELMTPDLMRAIAPALDSTQVEQFRALVGQLGTASLY